jgi:hypothetical protein
MNEDADALLRRAASVWAKSQLLHEEPTRAGIPLSLSLVDEIAEREDCHVGLVELLSSPHPLVVGYALAVLARKASPILAELSDELCNRRENLSIQCGSVRTSMDLGGLARQYRKRARENAT